MSSLKTYDLRHPDGSPVDLGLVVVDEEDEVAKTRWIPGVWVTDRAVGGFGMVVAVNDEQLTILWSQEPQWPQGFGKIAFPLVKRVQTPLIANQLVSIQPMTQPSGLLFYMDYKYGCKTNGWCSSLFKRARCIPSRLASSSSWSRSQSTKKSTRNVLGDYETKLLDELVSAGASLKERAARRLFGRTAGVSECPPAALEKTRTSPGT